MPARAAGLPPAAAGASTYDWSGFYLGGTAGVAWGSLGLKSNTPFTGAYFPDTATLGAVNATGVQTFKPHGFPVGLEAGFNWQAPHAPWVVGFEADIQSLRLSGGMQSGPVSYPGFPRAFFTLSSAASVGERIFGARPRHGQAAGAPPRNAGVVTFSPNTEVPNGSAKSVVPAAAPTWPPT